MGHEFNGGIDEACASYVNELAQFLCAQLIFYDRHSPIFSLSTCTAFLLLLQLPFGASIAANFLTNFQEACANAAPSDTHLDARGQPLLTPLRQGFLFDQIALPMVLLLLLFLFPFQSTV